MNQIITKKLQQALGLMFFHVTQVLDENNINYFAVGGTLLGAVRHKGFIPWDDDVDISLFREDYELFLKVADQILPYPYRLEKPNQNSDYPYLFAKIYNTETTLVEGFSQPLKRGVYIDIFPIDSITDNKKLQAIKIKKHRLFQKIYRRVYGGPVKSRHFLGRIFHPIIKFFLKFIFSRDKIIQLVQKNIGPNNPNTKFINNYFGSWRLKEVHKIEWYKHTIKIEFLNFKISAPAGYDKILSTLYGNYMELPPAAKQVSHHTIAYIDLELPYEIKK